MKTKDQIGDEALGALGDLRKAGVDISMGVGKTLLAIRHMAKNYTDTSRFLVSAPTKVIIKGWHDELVKHNYEYLIKHIVFTTYRSLPKLDIDYDCIYLDECHSLKATHNKWLLAYVTNGGRIVGLTGTYPAKARSEKGKMCNFYCPKVYTYHTDDAIADKLLNNYKIILHSVALDPLPTLEKTGAHGTWKSSEVKDYTYWCSAIATAQGLNRQKASIQRMKAIQGYPSKEVYAQKLLNEQSEKTILFANSQEQADRMCSHSFHANNDESDYNLTAFKKGDILKLSAVEKLNMRANIPDLRVGIILHSYGNNRQASQKLGRLLRLNPDDTSTIHILVYKATVDEEWVKSALEKYDQSKISWFKPALDYA